MKTCPCVKPWSAAYIRQNTESVYTGIYRYMLPMTIFNTLSYDIKTK